ncbi:DUF6597 domain-containing transcriptional factor [Paenarthrobacter ureafaciens]
MEYAEVPAPAALSPFVEGFWFLRAEPKARYEKILPGPSAHLILNLSEPYRLIRPREATGMDREPAEVAVGFYAGVQSSYLISENPERLHNVGVRLAPFALAAFTSQLPSEFQGNVVDAQYVFPGFADLRSQLLDAEPEQAFDALESFLRGAFDPRIPRPIPGPWKPWKPLLGRTWRSEFWPAGWASAPRPWNGS